MDDTGIEAGELSDAELNMVTGGAKAAGAEQIAETAVRVDHIQDLLSELARPNGSSLAAGIGRGKGAATLAPDELGLVRDVQQVLLKFEKSHDLDDKAGKASNGGKAHDDGGPASGVPHAGPVAVPKSQSNDSDPEVKKPLKLVKGEQVENAKDEHAPKSLKGGIVSDAEVAKLARVEKVLEKIASLDDPTAKKKSAKAALSEQIDTLVAKAKSQGQPYPEKEVDKLQKAEKARISDLEQSGQREEKALIDEAKKLGKPFPSQAIEGVRTKTKNSIDGAPDDLPNSRVALFAELKTLTADFEKIQKEEEGMKGRASTTFADLRAKDV